MFGADSAQADVGEKYAGTCDVEAPELVKLKVGLLSREITTRFQSYFS